MRTIDTDGLKRAVDGHEDLLLINALTPTMFDHEHIPGSHNVPRNAPDVVAQVEQLAGRKDRRIVVYCTSPECHASTAEAEMLEQAGFTNVSHYPGGIAEWKARGLPLEHAAGHSHGR